MHRVAVFIGTRPAAIKMAPVVAALRQEPSLAPVVINSGQHLEMIKQVIDLFGIHIDAQLQVMQPEQTLAGLTARLIERIDEVLEQLAPDVVLVQGDTTTVLCAALASFYCRIPIGHVEAGLRTGNLASPFPEEANRRMVSPLAQLHFSPTETARQALLAEGIDDGSILVTGNTVIDALLIECERQQQPAVIEQLRSDLQKEIGKDWPERAYVLVTGHRRESFGEGFEQICLALRQLAERFSELLFIYPVHLNPRVQQVVHQRLASTKNIRLIHPQSYSHFVALEAGARLILTDSGGVQEESPSLGKPVLVMRDTTERPEGVEAGAVKLVGPDAGRIVAATTELLTDENAYRQMVTNKNPYGDGHAASRIAVRVNQFLSTLASRVN